MLPSHDRWYIRFPDGQILRAADTSAVRAQLETGRLPPGIRLKRSVHEEWRKLERCPEFADLIPVNGLDKTPPPAVSVVEPAAGPATIASRLDPNRLDQIGMRSYFENLLAALDSTFVPCKIQATLLAGGLLGIVGGLISLSRSNLAGGGRWVLVMLGLVVLSWMCVVLVRMTYVELSRLRPARWKDTWSGMVRMTVRLSIVLALGIGLLGGLLTLLREMPGWLQEPMGGGSSLVGQMPSKIVVFLTVPGQVVVWGLGILLLPLVILIVVEECSILTGLLQWLRLVRDSMGKLLLAEALLLSMCCLLSLPLAGIMMLVQTSPAGDGLEETMEMARMVVGGMLYSFPVAYLIVANVFLYLSLRYEKREI